MTSVLVLIPLIALAFVSTAGRVVTCLFGLLMFSVEFFMDFGGHNPAGIIPFFGVCLALASFLAELLVRAMGFARRRRADSEEAGN
jgi:hypothetical protein